jgi:UDP-2-acetamido-3-amino-2,3-dideoxy-glucuronate N-acetyltransferase
MDELRQLRHPPPEPMSVSPSEARDVALIGAGSWGRNLARCFEAHGALRSVVVPAGEAEPLRASFPRAAFTSSISDVLSDPAVRKVAIATPSATHFELARAALTAGKDVFVEKPLCLHADHADILTQLAESSGRTLMVGHLLQYHPCVIKLRELVNAGALGELLTVTSNRLNLGKFRTDENALYSFAPHDVSLILSLLDDRLPESVRCVGGSWLKRGVADSTTTFLQFASGTLAQLYVSWLNPFKEQKLTVVGTRGMAVFDDMRPWSEKLVLYGDYMSAAESLPRTTGTPQLVTEEEPLLLECGHFLSACATGARPRTDGREGVRVLRVLDMAQLSLERGGERVTNSSAKPARADYFAHPSAVIDEGACIGAGSKIWHFSHVMAGARIGERCSFGQNVYVAGSVQIGDDVRVQNNVSLYDGVELENAVFVGPSCVFTNVRRPRAGLDQKHAYQKTRVCQGATLGANATLVCGITVGRYGFIAAGAVVTRDVPDYALMRGNPARREGWVSNRGQQLQPDQRGIWTCPESGLRYREVAPDRLECLDPSAEAMESAQCSSTI